MFSSNFLLGLAIVNALFFFLQMVIYSIIDKTRYAIGACVNLFAVGLLLLALRVT